MGEKRRKEAQLNHKIVTLAPMHHHTTLLVHYHPHDPHQEHLGAVEQQLQHIGPVSSCTHRAALGLCPWEVAATPRVPGAEDEHNSSLPAQ